MFSFLPPLSMKRFLASLAVASALLPALASAATPTTVLFSVDLCKYSVQMNGKIYTLVGVAPLCGGTKTFNVSFGSLLLCRGDYVIRQGAVNVTPTFVAANCTGV